MTEEELSFGLLQGGNIQHFKISGMCFQISVVWVVFSGRQEEITYFADVSVDIFTRQFVNRNKF